MSYEIWQGDCLTFNDRLPELHLTFFDPPFLQGKEYRFFDDNMAPEEYWGWIKERLQMVRSHTVEGGAVYFMQISKNTMLVLNALEETNWTLQNLIIWKKQTSATPGNIRFGKQYQIIAFATKGTHPRLFNPLRYDAPIPSRYTTLWREAGFGVTDLWDDLQELTAGFLAGKEPFRDLNGKRLHKQQSPVALLLRILLASTMPNDMVFDPFMGSGTTLVVARQLLRNAIGIDIDPGFVKLSENRLARLRKADDVTSWFDYYCFTPELDQIWGAPVSRQTTLLKSRQLITRRRKRGEKVLHMTEHELRSTKTLDEFNNR